MTLILNHNRFSVYDEDNKSRKLLQQDFIGSCEVTSLFYHCGDG